MQLHGMAIWRAIRRLDGTRDACYVQRGASGYMQVANASFRMYAMASHVNAYQTCCEKDITLASAMAVVDDADESPSVGQQLLACPNDVRDGRRDFLSIHNMM